MIRDSIPQLVGTVPLRTGAAVLAFLCFFHRGASLIVACLVTAGQISGNELI